MHNLIHPPTPQWGGERDGVGGTEAEEGREGKTPHRISLQI
jgi:hypothetical protein